MYCICVLSVLFTIGYTVHTSPISTIGEVMYCICVSNSKYQFYLLLETVHVLLHIVNKTDYPTIAHIYCT